MNIATDIQSFLNRSGWSAWRLAKEAGVSVQAITRVLTGKRKGMHSETLGKLHPYLYGETLPPPDPGRRDLDQGIPAAGRRCADTTRAKAALEVQPEPEQETRP